MDKQIRASGGFLGLALGDALGAQVEFKERGSFPPVTDMVGGGVFNLLPGQVTDDTEMALILARSLLLHKEFNPLDVMDRYLKWADTSFDVGNTIKSALERYRVTKKPFQGRTDVNTSGNGSIMRLYPSIIWTLHLPYDQASDLIWETTRLTHASELVKVTTQKMHRVIRKIFEGYTKEQVLEGIAITSSPNASGFVCDTFDAAVWGFATSNCFKEGLLKVVNLGDDADTVGAVYGQIAGSWYGMDGLPKEWLDKLQYRKEIEELTLNLLGTQGLK